MRFLWVIPVLALVVFGVWRGQQPTFDDGKAWAETQSTETCLKLVDLYYNSGEEAIADEFSELTNVPMARGAHAVCDYNTLGMRYPSTDSNGEAPCRAEDIGDYAYCPPPDINYDDLYPREDS